MLAISLKQVLMVLGWYFEVGCSLRVHIRPVSGGSFINNLIGMEIHSKFCSEQVEIQNILPG